jgi:hypothetical protein
MPIGPEYGTPTVPLGGEVRVSVVAGSTVNPTGPVTVSTGLPASVALTDRVTEPATVGVPLTTQPLIDKPAGSVPAMMVQL